MLQQTQVERVVPRYWVARAVADRRRARRRSLADVIRAWQGLGYNRRGLNLHRAARMVARDGWPDDLTQLPGVGRYTADAVARFALGEPVLPEDMNVRRVIERTGHRFGPECGQALMDLGATVCLARVPRCGICPLAAECPSRGRRYEPLRKQPRFEGSFRQRRARALRRGRRPAARRSSTPRRRGRARARRARRATRRARRLPELSATACAASPSPRPVKPRPSVVVARTETGPLDDERADSRCRISARRPAIRGSSPISTRPR